MLMIVMAAQMSRTIAPCPPELVACATTAVATTPRPIEPRAVTVIAVLRCPAGDGRTGGGPGWYPGGSMGPTYPGYPGTPYPAGAAGPAGAAPPGAPPARE